MNKVKGRSSNRYKINRNVLRASELQKNIYKV
jgi:hypothetical protein